MRQYAKISEMVTTRDGTCPEGYIEVENPIVNGGLQAIIRSQEMTIERLRREVTLADRVAVAGVRLANGGSEYVRQAVIDAYREYAKAIGRPEPSAAPASALESGPSPVVEAQGACEHEWHSPFPGVECPVCSADAGSAHPAASSDNSEPGEEV